MNTNSMVVTAMHKAIDKLAKQFDNNLMPDSVRQEVKTVTLVRRPVYKSETESSSSKVVVGEKIHAQAKVTLSFYAEHAELY